MAHHTVVLVPGFFGFQMLGDLRYFAGVADTIVRGLVGHSTGGLDLRLVLAPTASLPSDKPKKEILERVSTAVTVATPHLGTPLATFFAGAAGKPLLRMLASLFATLLDQGRLPVRTAIKLGEVLVRFDDVFGLRHTTLDQIYAQFLSDFNEERRLALETMLRDIASDQALLFQLTPAGLDILNAATADPEGVRYGSVVTGVEPPGLSTIRYLGRDVYAQALHAVFAMLYRISSNSAEAPELTEEETAMLTRTYGKVPDSHTNDGIVPTRAQLWGEPIAAVRSDHLDVVGHFSSKRIQGTSDWLPSGSHMNDERFETCWDAVAQFLCEDWRPLEEEDKGLEQVAEPKP